MLLLPIVEREKVLLVYKSLVSSHDFLNQALTKRFAASMLEAVPNHVRLKIWQKKGHWQSRILSTPGGTDLFGSGGNC